MRCGRPLRRRGRFRPDLASPWQILGTFVALLGRSGSGKTTLLRTLAGLDEVTEGEMQVSQKRTVVYQEPRLFPWKRVWRNVALGVRTPDARQRAEAALREVELAHRLNAWPLTLSGGERSAWRGHVRWCASPNYCCRRNLSRRSTR